METHLLDTMLNAYLAQGTPVTIMLQNRNRVSGRIRAFDSYVIVMENQRNEIVYRHALSSIFPTPVAAEARAPMQRPEQAKQTVKPAKNPLPSADRKKKDRPAPKAAASADPGINTAMKEGLLRWVQEQKAK